MNRTELIQALIYQYKYASYGRPYKESVKV